MLIPPAPSRANEPAIASTSTPPRRAWIESVPLSASRFKPVEPEIVSAPFVVTLDVPTASTENVEVPSIVIAPEASRSNAAESKSTATSAALPILMPVAPSMSIVVAASMSIAPCRLSISIVPESFLRFNPVEPDNVNAPFVVTLDAPTPSIENVEVESIAYVPVTSISRFAPALMSNKSADVISSSPDVTVERTKVAPVAVKFAAEVESRDRPTPSTVIAPEASRSHVDALKSTATSVDVPMLMPPEPSRANAPESASMSRAATDCNADPSNVPDK